MEEVLNQLASLTGQAAPTQQPDGYWINGAQIDPTEPAKICSAAGMRLSTMTAIAREDGETDVIYHFIKPQGSINLRVCTQNQHMPSITPILPSANWIEREIRDLYAVVFDGHPDPRRLVRPPEVPEGFFRQPGGAASKTASKATPSEERMA